MTRMPSLPLDRILHADVLDGLRSLSDESVHCVVTSPPYWGLRDYGVAGQIGLEPTPAAYLERMLEVFVEVLRVLRRDGTCWLNIGDSYAGSWGAQGQQGASGQVAGRSACAERQIACAARVDSGAGSLKRTPGLKNKDMCGIPWRLALALQAGGWWLRSDIIWAKPNPMPESVTDRPTKSHEYLFLLTKAERYFYDAAAIREPAAGSNDHDLTGPGYAAPGQSAHTGTRKAKVPGGWDTGAGAHGTIHRDGRTSAEYQVVETLPGRNARSVWSIATEPCPEAHFATFPQSLVTRCIKAGCPAGGVVLDPFMGSGTVALVAKKLGRHFIGVELNADYIRIAEKRLQPVGLLMEASA